PGITRPGFDDTVAANVDASWKSTTLKRGDFMSACDQPPPTICGIVLTSSSTVAAAAVPVRNVRGWSSTPGSSQPRDSYFTSSVLCCGGGGVSLSPRPGHGLKPASSTRTVLPAAVSAHAALLPPGPLPMMQKSNDERLVFPRTSTIVLLRRLAIGLRQ